MYLDDGRVFVTFPGSGAAVLAEDELEPASEGSDRSDAATTASERLGPGIPGDTVASQHGLRGMTPSD
jgi:hypothetical protein